jgi:hypothetical protein
MCEHYALIDVGCTGVFHCTRCGEERPLPPSPVVDEKTKQAIQRFANMWNMYMFWKKLFWLG